MGSLTAQLKACVLFLFVIAAPALSGAAPVSGAEPETARLKSALAEYRSIAAGGGWPEIPPGPDLAMGQRDSRVDLIRRRLQATGDHTAEVGADTFFFDASLADAVRAFQARHGLWVDGVVGEPTRDTLNIPIDARVAQIELALSRYRELPANLGPKYVWVNIPAATAQVVDRGEPSILMRAVVGHPTRPTPVIRSSVHRLVFDPPWSVPDSLAVEDILPRQQKDPDYLSRSRIRVFKGWSADARELDPAEIDWSALGPGRFPYRFRQDPGPWNSLGRIKIDFPNSEDIYVHDTPNKLLFDLPMRGFSAGCIRLEDAPAFVSALMSHEQDWTGVPDTAGEIQTRFVDLSEPVPIYIVYLTSWVSPDGRVHFRPDIYGKDASAGTGDNEKLNVVQEQGA